MVWNVPAQNVIVKKVIAEKEKVTQNRNLYQEWDE